MSWMHPRSGDEWGFPGPVGELGTLQRDAGDGWRSAGRTEGTWGPRGRWRHLPWVGVGCWLMPWPSWSVSQSCMRMKGSRPFCVSLLHGLGRDSMSLTLPWDSPST